MLGRATAKVRSSTVRLVERGEIHFNEKGNILKVVELQLQGLQMTVALKYVTLESYGVEKNTLRMFMHFVV